MTVFLDLLAAVLLAFCFIPVGDAILGRMSSSLPEWNEAFLVGSTVVAAILFPVSLLLGSAALWFLVVTTVGLAAVWIYFRFRSRPARNGEPGYQFPPALSLVPVILIGLCLFYFFWQNLSYSPETDGRNIWAWRAALLLREGDLSSYLWPDYGYFSRVMDYPPLIPLLEAFMGCFRGDSLLQHSKAVFCLFYCSLAISLFVAANRIAGQLPALWTTAAVLVLPGITMGSNLTGFADLPVAAITAAICAAALGQQRIVISWRDPILWLIAGLLTVKNEGNILFLVGCIFVALLWVSARKTVQANPEVVWKAAAVLISAQLLRTAYVRWIGLSDKTYGPIDEVHLVRALFMWADIPEYSWRFLTDLKSWGLLWVAFIPCSLLVIWKSETSMRIVALASTGCLLLYTGIFYFTNWNIQTHMETAYPRLLEQIAPPAALVVLAAWKSLEQMAPPKPETQEPGDSIASEIIGEPSEQPVAEVAKPKTRRRKRLRQQ